MSGMTRWLRKVLGIRSPSKEFLAMEAPKAPVEYTWSDRHRSWFDGTSTVSGYSRCPRERCGSRAMYERENAVVVDGKIQHKKCPPCKHPTVALNGTWFFCHNCEVEWEDTCPPRCDTV